MEFKSGDIIQYNHMGANKYIVVDTELNPNDYILLLIGYFSYGRFRASKERRPPIPEPQITPTRSGLTAPDSISLLSASASSEATIAN